MYHLTGLPLRLLRCSFGSLCRGSSRISNDLRSYLCSAGTDYVSRTISSLRKISALASRSLPSHAPLSDRVACLLELADGFLEFLVTAATLRQNVPMRKSENVWGRTQKLAHLPAGL